MIKELLERDCAEGNPPETTLADNLFQSYGVATWWLERGAPLPDPARDNTRLCIAVVRNLLTRKVN